MPRNPLLRGLRPVHPGEILREDVLPEFGRPKTEIARLLRVSRRTLCNVLNEKKPITADFALRIGKLVGGGPDIWLNMQRSYDLAVEGRVLAKKLKSIPTLRATE
jgi:addiction module HigA family antidote